MFNDVTGKFSENLVKDTPLLVVNEHGHVRWIPPLVVKYDTIYSPSEFIAIYRNENNILFLFSDSFSS